ncbi:8-amino-7-oxononanoate synthase, partial [Basidiobolus meristosporus CBS 931.73]
MSLEKQLAKIISRRDALSLTRSLVVSPKDSVDFSSNDYLGLSCNPKLQAMFRDELNSHMSALGATGSRLLDGNSEFAERLEQEIAEFHLAEDALLFNSGYDANLSMFATLPQPGDVVLFDEYIHASVHDGMRASRTKRRLSFRHNDVKHLEELLGRIEMDVNVFVAVEGVYSMDGDLARLKEIVQLKKIRPFYIIVDEAHSTGLFGDQGRGYVNELGLEEEVFARLHTFGKAMGAHGAVVLGSTLLKKYLINYARPLIYSTFMPHHSLVAIQCSYRILREDGEKLQRQVRSLIRRFRQNVAIPKELLLDSESSIQGIIVPGNDRCKQFSQYLNAKGFNVKPIRSPTVPAGRERVRICIHAHNTKHEIDALLKEVETYFRGESTTIHAKL